MMPIHSQLGHFVQNAHCEVDLVDEFKVASVKSERPPLACFPARPLAHEPDLCGVEDRVAEDDTFPLLPGKTEDFGGEGTGHAFLIGTIRTCTMLRCSSRHCRADG